LEGDYYASEQGKYFVLRLAWKCFGNQLEPFEDVPRKSRLVHLRLQKQLTLATIMKEIRGENEDSEWLLVFLLLPASPAGKETRSYDRIPCHSRTVELVFVYLPILNTHSQSNYDTERIPLDCRYSLLETNI
jgi:hypothetical protein